MSARDRRLVGLALALTLAEAVLLAVQVGGDQLAEGAGRTRPVDLGLLGSDLYGTFTVLVFAVVGFVVVRRYSRHVVGWLFVLTNLPWALNSASGAWVRLAASGVSLPGVPLAVWLYPWQGDLGFGMTIALLYVFPNGSLPSRSWRAAAWFLAAITLAGAAAAALTPGTVDPTIGVPVENPLALHGLAGELLLAISRWQFVAFMVAIGIGVAAIAVRFVRSRGLERQQLKWFVWAASIFGLLLVAGVLTSPLGDTTNAFWMIALVMLPLIPIAAGLAMLRYRLYDVDVVINRTIVYATLSAVLAAVYGVSVLGLGSLLGPLTGSGSLAVAVSTLLVAALFTPVRRRVQAVVDRRFYRRRYDAGREIAGFGARLRDEVEPDRLAAAIASTLERTVQPAFASIWLRPGAER